MQIESITFTDVVAATNLSVGHHIDGVNVTQLLPNVFFDQTPHVQLGRVRFDHLIIEGNLEIGSGMINDVDILALNASALRLDTNQLVEGSIVFTQVCPYKNRQLISKFNCLLIYIGCPSSKLSYS